MIGSILAGILGLGSITIVVRGVIADRNHADARATAKPGVEAFKRRYCRTRNLPARYRVTNDGLLTMIVAARNARSEILEQLRSKVPPSESSFDLLPALEERMERASNGFFEILKTTYLVKVRSLAVGQIADRFDDRLNILHHAKHDLTAVERGVTDLLDSLGVIDFAEGAFELIPEVIRQYSEYAADAAANGISDFLQTTATIYHVPGLIGATRDVIQEFRFLVEDDISLGEVFTDGAIPSALRVILTKIGVALDTATGWLSLGLFTVACNWFGKLLSTELLHDRLKEQVDIVNHHVETIRNRQRRAMGKIREAVEELIEAFRKEVELCPDIGDEPALKAYVDHLLRAYGDGVGQASLSAAAAVKREIARLPFPSPIDRLFGIDRRSAISDLFLEAQRELDSHHLGLTHSFSVAYERHAEHAIQFLQAERIFTNAESRRVLPRSDEVLVRTAGDYANSLGAWEERCRSIWEAGATSIQKVTQREHSETRVVVKREMAAIQDARRRIAILRRRLGQKEMAA